MGVSMVTLVAPVVPHRHGPLSQTQSADAVKEVKLVTTKLGGQLEPFADVSKGYRLAKPLGWNRYDGTSGEYAVKMVDLIDPTTVILLTNSPVKSDTQVGVESLWGGRFFLKGERSAGERLCAYLSRGVDVSGVVGRGP